MSQKIAIIGGGPGGYVAAIRAAQLKNEVTLFEKDQLGGTCTNRGCIPTKALIHSANVYWQARNSQAFGIKIPQVGLNYPAVLERKDAVVKRLVSGVGLLMKKNRIKVIKGEATLSNAQTISVLKTGEKITADKIILATGSVPAGFPTESFDQKGVISSNEALALEQLPSRLVIIGGGVIGIEFAQLMHRMGVKITVIEQMGSILPAEDNETVRVLSDLLEKEGLELITGAGVKRIEADGKGGKLVVFGLNGKDHIRSADLVLVATGRKPCTSNLGLESLGIPLTDKNHIVVNERMETGVPGIYAIGDVTGGIMLAHAAMAEGICAVENACGIGRPMNYRPIPRCVYTAPELASAGLTEAEAKAHYGDKLKIGRFPLMANGKAAILNENEGLIKIVAEPKYGEIVGVTMVGPHATELIAEAVVAMSLEAGFEDLAAAVHAHPTVSESMMEAALDAGKMAIHK
ncbi:MAG: dihydrolipoyl dehydrogenase [Desulfobacteraceae bacterium]|nr:MAG: dihydrolipoyl dehydrogenase [Desulfobacteraceae bacterium]